MKVAVYYNNHDVRVEDRPKPDPESGEILVRTKACGVCVADTMEWYLTPRAPLTLGHEPTGIIELTGPDVAVLKIGDRVAVHHHVPCLICEHCRRGNFTMCQTFRKTHIHPGGFSEYFIASKIHVERDTLILPENVSYEAGTLVEPLACVIHAIRKAGIKAGDSVALIGTGTMGLMFIETLLYWGVRELVVYEMLDWRIQKAREFGANHVLVPDQDPEKEAERLKEILKSDGADKVIIAAKDISAMRLGLQLANKGGTVTFFATPHPDEYIELYPSYIFFNEITINSTYSADHLDTRMALNLIAKGDVSAEKIISHTFPIEKLSDAILQTASRHESLKCVITFD
ncbi:MAG TPA: alcohol dehydrogenase catalytic domain-containing protein [Pelolinea sp.]|nr:alcohol dehydrogenase catalytic domain-containing protein [Pelolinea sp.]